MAARRDLTAASQGTVYQSSDPHVATVSADGLVTAVGSGVTTITATNEHLDATAQVTVAISTGAGFLRGAVFDDSLGLPLAQATVLLLADGGGPLDEPFAIVADAQGQFVLPGLDGEALVRLEKEEFTSVERQGMIPKDTAMTLLDARLTPLDTHVQPIKSAVEGEARSTAGNISVMFVPGSLQADADIRLTMVSNQGLPGSCAAGLVPYHYGGRPA